jgi:hypothetical protein
MDPVSEQATGTGRPGRYNRSAGGLVGSILVLVLLVVGFVVFRGIFRQTPEFEPEHVDYRALVASVQSTGVKPAYPATLPDGWFAKDVEFTPGDRPVLSLAFATEDGRFAGIHEEDRGVDELVGQLMGGDATEGEPLSVSGSVASQWQSFSDPGGDHGYAAEVGRQTVLVYGSAPDAELRELVGSLTTATIR